MKNQAINEKTFDEEIELAKARQNLVVKDNRLIQSVTKRKYELSLLEQKCLGFIISLIKPPQNGNSTPQYNYTFDVRLFCKICGIDYENGNNYANVKAALQRLSDNSFWLDNGEEEVLMRWVDGAKITKRSGKINIRFSDEIMPYLFNLQERFTAYELYQTLALRSIYSVSLYEFFKSNAFKKNITVNIEELRTYLSIQEKYKEFRDLKKRVLTPAIEEINNYTDLNISWEPCKKGRNYVALRFTICSKEQKEGYAAYRRIMAEIKKK